MIVSIKYIHLIVSKLENTDRIKRIVLQEFYVGTTSYTVLKEEKFTMYKIKYIYGGR